MSESNQTESGADALPEVAVKTGRRFSIVWLIPIVAGAIAAWLAYTTLSEKGPVITILFDTAAGLEAGKTKVKHKNVEVGTVETVALTEDLNKVIVTVQMAKGANHYLTKGTQFWVVRPRLTAGGVSGLGTLVSGAFIEVNPGPGDPEKKFVGLEIPPVLKSDVPGDRYLLRAAQRGSVSRGSPIYFRGIEVGEVLGYELAADSREVFIHAFVREPHSRLVRADSRFWNASGIDIQMGAGGVQVNTESLQALLTGGIAFDTPVSAADDPQAPPGTTFQLYPNRTAMGEADFFEKFPFLMYFNGSVRGLEKGAPVEFRGIRVGSVTDVEMLIDIQAKTVQIPVHIVIEPQRVKRIGTPFKDAYEGINALVEKGMRGQLKVGNLLTGQLYVSLDFYPDLPRATLIRRKGEPPEIPTVPTELEEITRSVSLVLERLASLPLEGLVEDARKMTQAIERLAATPDIPLAVESIRQAAEAAEVTLAQATSALAATEGLVGPRSQVRTDLVGLMNELKNAARSVRVLTNYLERHPEALIHGKGGPRK